MQLILEQKTPNISDSDIKRIIERDFPQLEFIEIMGILRAYESESIKGRNRIYASILKLSDGNIEMMKKYVRKANNDYRDVVASAEYPSYSEHIFDDDLPAKKKKQFITDDWMEYQTWFNRV